MPDAMDGLVVPEAARAMETAHFFQGVVNGINFANEWDLRAVTGTDFLAVETADGDELCRTARSEVEHPRDVLSWMADEPALRLAMAAVRSANAMVTPPGKQPAPPRGAQELRRIEASKAEIPEKLERLIAKEREEGLSSRTFSEPERMAVARVVNELISKESGPEIPWEELEADGVRYCLQWADRILAVIKGD